MRWRCSEEEEGKVLIEEEESSLGEDTRVPRELTEEGEAEEAAVVWNGLLSSFRCIDSPSSPAGLLRFLLSSLALIRSFSLLHVACSF